MAAIPNQERIISAFLFSLILGILAAEQQITALLGEYGAAASIIGVIFFIALRELVKELGQQNGDLNQTTEIEKLQNQITALENELVAKNIVDETTLREGQNLSSEYKKGYVAGYQAQTGTTSDEDE